MVLGLGIHMQKNGVGHHIQKLSQNVSVYLCARNIKFLEEN